VKIEVAAREGDLPRCVYCRADVASPAELDECPGCRTTLHIACRAELGRCPTVGCAPTRPAARPVPRVADPSPGVRRPRSRGELGLAVACGALIGLFVGWFIAAMTSRHGVEAKEMWRFMPLSTLVGALEAAAICALGVRKEPWVQVHWTVERERRHDAIPIVLGLLVVLAVGGGYFAADLLHTPRGFVTGLIACPLLALPLLLRCLGWSEGRR
jgi:hypothetical protein